MILSSCIGRNDTTDFDFCSPFGLPGQPSSNVGLSGIAIDGPCKVATFFATADRGVVPHDTVVIEKTKPGKFIGLDVPYYYFGQNNASKSKSRKRGKASDSADCSVGHQLMQNFTGAEALNENMKSSLIAFSFNLAIGDMDKAYQEMRLIRDTAVGYIMSQHPFVTTKSIAAMCILNIGQRLSFSRSR